MKKLIFLFTTAFFALVGNTELKAQCFANAGPDLNFCCGGVTTLSVAFSNSAACTCTNITYTWTPSTGLSNPNIANPTATIANITYTVCVTARTGTSCVACCTACDVIKLKVTTPSCCKIMNVNKENLMDIGINVFPNPAKNNMTIDIAKKLDNAEVSLFDISGKLVWKKENTLGDDKIEVNTSTLTRGIYFVKIIEKGKEIYTNKIVLE